MQEKPVKLIHKGQQSSLTHFRFQLALPYRNTMPPHSRQLALHLTVTLLVPSYLINPELCVRPWYPATFRTLHYELWIMHCDLRMVTVPETSINEYTRLILPQHHIRLPRQPRMVKTIAETMRPQEVSHYHLRLSILTMDSCHIHMSLLWCQSISHNHPLPLSYYTLYRYRTSITIAIQNTKLQIKSHNPPFSFPFRYQTEEKKEKVIIPIIEPLQKILDEIAAEPVHNG